jgi:Fungal chitosanase of glycosyl hydrolase group 75
MSTPKFLTPAISADQLQAQVRDQELAFGMEVLGIGICQTPDNPPLRNNFVELTSLLADQLPELQVKVVAREIAADDTQFANFLAGLGVETSIVDSAMVLIDDAEQQIVLFRTGAVSNSPPISQPPSDLAPKLPDYAQNILSATNGVPWSKCETLHGMDAYTGIMPGQSRLFRNLRGPDGPMDVVYYECKFDVDNDGSGGNSGNDPFHQTDTSLHDIQGIALDANQVPFAVLPLDRAQSSVKPPGLTDFGKGLGLGVGDVGIAFWRAKSSGPVQSCCFIYGDTGPSNKLGEGSIHLASALGIDPNPVSGGIDSRTIQRLGKGIVHIAFPGSGKDFLTRGHRLMSSLLPDRFEAHAKQLFASFLRQ